jgi:hypothetical protein
MTNSDQKSDQKSFVFEGLGFLGFGVGWLVSHLRARSVNAGRRGAQGGASSTSGHTPGRALPPWEGEWVARVSRPRLEASGHHTETSTASKARAWDGQAHKGTEPEPIAAHRVDQSTNRRTLI